MRIVLQYYPHLSSLSWPKAQILVLRPLSLLHHLFYFMLWWYSVNSKGLRPLATTLLSCIRFWYNTIFFFTNDNSSFPFCFNDSMHWRWQWLHKFVQNLMTHVMTLCLTQLLVTTQNYCLSQYLNAAIYVQQGWCQVTVGECSSQSGLLCLHWSSDSSCKAFWCIWGHGPPSTLTGPQLHNGCSTYLTIIFCKI